GTRCPFGSHTRRTNPRSGLMFAAKGGFGQPAFDTPAALSNRRRILRRGLPYGLVEDRPTDDGDHGVIMIILNADLSRQFEFVQQQWVNFGTTSGWRTTRIRCSATMGSMPTAGVPDGW